MDREGIDLVDHNITSIEQYGHCPYCSNPPYHFVYHAGTQCPKIKAIEYYPDGRVKRIEFVNEIEPDKDIESEYNLHG